MEINNKQEKQKIEAEKYKFEEVENCMYLGTVINNRNGRSD